MDFAYPTELSEFREEFGRYLDSVVTPELVEETRYFDKKGKEQVDQRTTHSDRLNVQIYSQAVVTREGVTISRAKDTNSDIFLSIARKMIPGPKGDKTNLGGEIMVIVRADKEPRQK